jgi:kinetochore protein Spc7/SPC105
MDGDSQGKEGLLIDFETTPGAPAADNDDTANPFDTFNATSAIREEMAATKERDEKERKDRERQNILEKREARRKSMGSCLLHSMAEVRANKALHSKSASFVCP